MEYLCINNIGENEQQEVEGSKYLGSTIDQNGSSKKEVKKGSQAGWNSWQKMTGILSCRQVPTKIKKKAYKTVVRLAMIYGMVRAVERRARAPGLRL